MQIISLITAIISMLATIIIGILQVIQNKKLINVMSKDVKI